MAVCFRAEGPLERYLHPLSTHVRAHTLTHTSCTYHHHHGHVSCTHCVRFLADRANVASSPPLWEFLRVARPENAAHARKLGSKLGLGLVLGVPSDEYDAALGRWNTVFLATLLWSGVCNPRPPARPPVSAWLQPHTMSASSL